MLALSSTTKNAYSKQLFIGKNGKKRQFRCNFEQKNSKYNKTHYIKQLLSWLACGVLFFWCIRFENGNGCGLVKVVSLKFLLFLECAVLELGKIMLALTWLQSMRNMKYILVAQRELGSLEKLNKAKGDDVCQTAPPKCKG